MVRTGFISYVVIIANPDKSEEICKAWSDEAAKMNLKAASFGGRYFVSVYCIPVLDGYDDDTIIGRSVFAVGRKAAIALEAETDELVKDNCVEDCDYYYDDDVYCYLSVILCEDCDAKGDLLLKIALVSSDMTFSCGVGIRDYPPKIFYADDEDDDDCIFSLSASFRRFVSSYIKWEEIWLSIYHFCDIDEIIEEVSGFWPDLA